MNLAERLRMLREAKGVGQKVVAIYLHVSVSTVSNYESGAHQPDLDTLQKLADFYGISIESLIVGEREPDVTSKLREQIFLKCHGLSEDNLRTLRQIAQFMRHYEVNIKPTDNY